MKDVLERITTWTKEHWRTPEFWLTFSAYAIPLAFLLYVLYINFLPFGYNKTFVINVGAQGDTDSSKPFYLEPSRDLSDRLTDENGKPSRTLNGSATAVFNPGVVLKNAKVTVSVEGGEGISIIPPVINFDPASVKWDYSWNFATSIPSTLKGDAYHFDDCAYFDGKSKLELSNSADKFESGPFTVYAEWTPQNSTDNFQEIVGHFNWELVQNKDSVTFQVGRMNDGNGPAYSIKYPINADFFNKKHTMIAIYNPSRNGYISLYVDGNFAGRTYFGIDKIWKDYGNKNISLGKSDHGIAQYFKGVLCKIALTSKNTVPNQTKIDSVVNDENSVSISLVSIATSTLNTIKIDAAQK